MTEVLALKAEIRSNAGKSESRELRRQGRIPAVIYGDKKSATLITLHPVDLDKHYQKEGFFTKLLDISIDKKNERVLPRDVQIDPVSDRVIHVDFMRVTAATRIKVAIPVHVKNELASPGLKRGGVLNIVQHAIEVYCRADSIPPHFTVDLTGLDIGDSVHISALKLPEGIKPVIADRDFTVIAINPPTVVQEEVKPAAATAEGAAPAEGAAAAPGAAPGAAAPAAGAAAKPGDAKAAAPAAGAKAAAPAAKK